MAYDVELSRKLGEAIADMLDDDGSGVEKKRMMGGACFMLHGNMVCGADKAKDGQRRFMFRTGKGNSKADSLPGGEPMVQGGRLMSGFYFVDSAGCDDVLLRRWLGVALDHAKSLPAK
jgi:hypothetical protein